MAVSRDARHRQPRGFWRGLFAQLSWFDVVLAAIPLVFAFALVSYVVLPLSLHAAMAGGAVVSSALVADALFVHTPGSPKSH